MVELNVKEIIEGLGTGREEIDQTLEIGTSV